MDIVEYFKEKNRMTQDCSLCDDCPLGDNRRDTSCSHFENNYPNEAAAIVEQWAKEHPVKTYKSVFLEKFPDAMFSEHGEVDFCVQYVFGKKVKPKACGDCRCAYCWNREVEE